MSIRKYHVNICVCTFAAFSMYVCVCLKHEWSYERSWIRSLNDVSESCSLLFCQAQKPPAKLSKDSISHENKPPCFLSLSPSNAMSRPLSLSL